MFFKNLFESRTFHCFTTANKKTMIRRIKSDSSVYKCHKNFVVDYEKVSHGDIISFGSYGIVKFGTLKLSKLTVNCAIKIFNIGNSNENKKKFEHEAKLVSKCDHENVVSILGYYIKDVKEGGGNIGMHNSGKIGCIVMELCGKRDLSALLKDKTVKFTQLQNVRCMIDIAKGMKYLHDIGIVHRDLKPGNILVGATDGKMKICDFGTSKNVTSVDGTFCGTSYYMPPEQIQGTKMKKDLYNLGDIYSFGVTSWEIWTRERPYQDWRKEPGFTEFNLMGMVVHKDLRPDVKKLGKRCPKELKCLISSCFEKDLLKRPKSFDVILKELVIIRKNIEERERIKRFSLF